MQLDRAAEGVALLRETKRKGGVNVVNIAVALWDPLSLYSIAMVDSEIARDIKSNDMAKARYAYRIEWPDPDIVEWSAMEQRLVRFIKARSQPVNYRHVAICAYAVVAGMDWVVKWRFGQYSVRAMRLVGDSYDICPSVPGLGDVLDPEHFITYARRAAFARFSVDEQDAHMHQSTFERQPFANKQQEARYTGVHHTGLVVHHFASTHLEAQLECAIVLYALFHLPDFVVAEDARFLREEMDAAGYIEFTELKPQLIFIPDEALVSKRKGFFSLFTKKETGPVSLWKTLAAADGPGIRPVAANTATNKTQ